MKKFLVSSIMVGMLAFSFGGAPAFAMETSTTIDGNAYDQDTKQNPSSSLDNPTRKMGGGPAYKLHNKLR